MNFDMNIFCLTLDILSDHGFISSNIMVLLSEMLNAILVAWGK